mmetsp:Transcript_11675/g.31383  ORF Transcript_11675/g.31383 Transcript_11675/m.31383 type:complete len:227 (+) Transcript_11675:1178-1858(+)
MLHHVPAFAGDRFGIRRPAEGREGVLKINRFRMEPAWRLPAVGEAELRAVATKDRDDVVLGTLGVDDGPRARHVLVEIRGEVIPAVGLLYFIGDPLRRRPLAVPCGVGLGELVRRLAVLHPVHNVSPQASAMGDAVGLSTRVPIVRDLIRRADEVVPVRGPASGPVQDGLDPRGFDDGDEVGRVLHAVHKPLDVPVEKVIRQIRRHGALPTGGRELHDILVLVRPN